MYIKASVSPHYFPPLFSEVRAHPLVMLLFGYIACIMFVCWSSVRVAYDVIYVRMHRSFRVCCCCDCSLVAAPNVCKAPFITIDMRSLLFSVLTTFRMSKSAVLSYHSNRKY